MVASETLDPVAACRGARAASASASCLRQLAALSKSKCRKRDRCSSSSIDLSLSRSGLLSHGTGSMPPAWGAPILLAVAMFARAERLNNNCICNSESSTTCTSRRLSRNISTSSADDYTRQVVIYRMIALICLLALSSSTRPKYSTQINSLTQSCLLACGAFRAWSSPPTAPAHSRYSTPLSGVLWSV